MHLFVITASYLLHLGPPSIGRYRQIHYTGISCYIFFHIILMGYKKIVFVFHSGTQNAILCRKIKFKQTSRHPGTGR